ncbi:MAG: hypothetical protein ACXWPM_12125 [Bdellovibrionota bacterium]
MNSATSNRITLVGVLLALIGAQAWTNLTLRQLDAPWVEPPSESSGKWNPRIFQMLTFGHWPAAIDWLWMKLLQDQSLDHVLPGVHPPAYYDLDLATDLDPAFFDAYVAGGNYLAVIRDDKTGARDLVLKGKKFLLQKLQDYPEEFKYRFWGRGWNLMMLLAYIYLFELNDMPNAAIAFKEAAQLPNAPEYIIHLGQRLERPDGQYEVGIRLLGFMIQASNDNLVKSELEKKRYSLFIAQYLFNLNQAFQNYLNQMPDYRASSKLSSKKMQGFYENFLKTSQTPRTDPFGGSIRLGEDGRIDSTTERQKVFGLE